MRLVDEELDAAAADPVRLAAAVADAGVADDLVDGVAADPVTLEAIAAVDDLVDGVAAGPVTPEATADADDLVGDADDVLEVEASGELRPQRPQWMSRPV